MNDDEFNVIKTNKQKCTATHIINKMSEFVPYLFAYMFYFEWNSD